MGYSKINVIILMLTLGCGLNIASSKEVVITRHDQSDNTTFKNDTLIKNLEGYYYSNDASNVLIFASRFGSCSGVLLTKEWILTSAHCLVRKEEKIGNKAVQIFGEDDGVKGDTPQHSIEVHVHENYNSKTYKNDIALIKIDGAVKGSVSEAKLQSTPWQEGSEPRSNCFVVDYNTRIKDKKFQHYRVAYDTEARHGLHACPCINEHECLIRLVCVSGKRGCNYCTGSLGGALFCDGELVGIARQIVDCRQCDPDEPISDCGQRYIYRSYTYICPFRDWLKERVDSEQLNANVVCTGIKDCDTCVGNRLCHKNNLTKILLLLILLFLFTYE